jgi:hypothetical protein
MDGIEEMVAALERPHPSVAGLQDFFARFREAAG